VIVEFKVVRLKVACPLAVSQSVRLAGLAVGALVNVSEKLPEAVPGQPEPSEMPVSVKDPVPVRNVGMLTVFVEALYPGIKP
jgi:hypothetical protein